MRCAHAVRMVGVFDSFSPMAKGTAVTTGPIEQWMENKRSRQTDTRIDRRQPEKVQESKSGLGCMGGWGGGGREVVRVLRFLLSPKPHVVS